jgi:small subunit ribosomal protein S21
MPANVTIKVQRGDVAKAIKRFKKTVERSGLIGELRSRAYFLKPSEKRRAAQHRSKRRVIKALRQSYSKA